MNDSGFWSFICFYISLVGVQQCNGKKVIGLNKILQLKKSRSGMKYFSWKSHAVGQSNVVGKVSGWNKTLLQEKSLGERKCCYCKSHEEGQNLFYWKCHGERTTPPPPPHLVNFAVTNITMCVLFGLEMSYLVWELSLESFIQRSVF